MYAALRSRAPGQDPAKWPANYANLIWRLTPEGAESAFAARASAASLPEKERIAAITALGFTPTKGAAAAQSCLLCHRIGDKGNDYGPALNGFARGQATEVVINAILEPSAEIAHGYDGVAVDLKDGGQVHGVLLSGGDPVVVQSMGGLTQMIPAAKIRGSARKPLGRSLMLSADQLGLSAQDVADIVAYLKTI